MLQHVIHIAIIRSKAFTSTTYLYPIAQQFNNQKQATHSTWLHEPCNEQARSAQWHLRFSTKITIFWDERPCSIKDQYWRFRQIRCRHLQGWRKDYTELYHRSPQSSCTSSSSIKKSEILKTCWHLVCLFVCLFASYMPRVGHVRLMVVGRYSSYI